MLYQNLIWSLKFLKRLIFNLKFVLIYSNLLAKNACGKAILAVKMRK